MGVLSTKETPMDANCRDEAIGLFVTIYKEKNLLYPKSEDNLREKGVRLYEACKYNMKCCGIFTFLLI